MLILSTVTGILKGYDQLMNLVLDEVKETMRGKLLMSFPELYLFDFVVYILTLLTQTRRATRPPVQWV